MQPSFWTTIKNRNKDIAIIGVIAFLLLSFVFIASKANTDKKTSNTKAAEPQYQAAYPSTSIDPQTGEFYDLQIESHIETITRTGQPGPLYGARTVFDVGGTRVNTLTNLFGFSQESSPYGSNPIKFQLQTTTYPRFLSDKTDLLYNGCIDLYSTVTPAATSYVGTFCYNNTEISGPGNNLRAYSPNANPFLIFSYDGTRPAMIQILSTAFDNTKGLTGPFKGANIRGSKVNYVTADNLAASHFPQVTYIIQGLIGGLTNQQVAQICTTGPTFPKKYLKQTYGPKPEGGNNLEVSPSDLGGCAFTYTANHLIPFYISLYVDSGTPLPSPTTPSPTMAPISPPVAVNPSCKAQPVYVMAPVRITSPSAITTSGTQTVRWTKPSEATYSQVTIENLSTTVAQALQNQGPLLNQTYKDSVTTTTFTFVPKTKYRITVVAGNTCVKYTDTATITIR